MNLNKTVMKKVATHVAYNTTMIHVKGSDLLIYKLFEYLFTTR